MIRTEDNPALDVTLRPILSQLTCMTNVGCFSTRCLTLQGYLRDVWVQVSYTTSA